MVQSLRGLKPLITGVFSFLLLIQSTSLYAIDPEILADISENAPTVFVIGDVADRRYMDSASNAAASGELTDARYQELLDSIDSFIDISDGLYILNYLFQGGPAPEALQAADVDASGVVDIADGVALFSYLFQGGPRPVALGMIQLAAPSGSSSATRRYFEGLPILFERMYRNDLALRAGPQTPRRSSNYTEEFIEQISETIGEFMAEGESIFDGSDPLWEPLSQNSAPDGGIAGLASFSDLQEIKQRVSSWLVTYPYGKVSHEYPGSLTPESGYDCEQHPGHIQYNPIDVYVYVPGLGNGTGADGLNVAVLIEKMAQRSLRNKDLWVYRNDESLSAKDNGLRLMNSIANEMYDRLETRCGSTGGNSEGWRQPIEPIRLRIKVFGYCAGGVTALYASEYGTFRPFGGPARDEMNFMWEFYTVSAPTNGYVPFGFENWWPSTALMSRFTRSIGTGMDDFRGPNIGVCRARLFTENYDMGALDSFTFWESIPQTFNEAAQSTSSESLPGVDVIESTHGGYWHLDAFAAQIYHDPNALSAACF